MILLIIYSIAITILFIVSIGIINHRNSIIKRYVDISDTLIETHKHKDEVIKNMKKTIDNYKNVLNPKK